MSGIARSLAIGVAMAAVTPVAFSQHVDPSANAHAQDLTFARHVNSAFTTAFLDPALQFGTRLLQRCDATPAADQDVACGVTLRRSGTIATFGTAADGNDVITTQAQMDTVIALSVARIKVVTAISACGGVIDPSIVGCGYVGSSGIVSENGLTTELTGTEITHEFGHNQGLNHRGDPGAPAAIGNPLMENPVNGRNEVNLTECAAYHSGGVDIGVNTPVDFPPNITCPISTTVECSSTGGTPRTDAQLTGFLTAASAEDGCEPTPTIANDSPILFPVNQATSVTFTATDAGNLTDACFATVTVLDTVTPTIRCPSDLTVECTGNAGVPATDPRVAALLVGASASDVCDSTPTITNDAPTFFGLGSTTVTFTATDDSTNTSQCTTTVIVADTQAPTITALVEPTELWPPNHRLVTIRGHVIVFDVCDSNPTFFLSSIVSDEPDNGLGDGDTASDIQGAQFGTPDTAFQLRAERAGSGDGRTYSVLYTVLDSAGNTSTATATVVVPHNQSGR